MLFDTSSFLKWWFAGKKTPETFPANSDRVSAGAEKSLVETTDAERMSNPMMSMDNELTSSNGRTSSLGKSSAANIARSSIDSPSFLAGYMDFDPMVAATRSHSNSHQRNRRSSWFNRSD